MSTQNICFGAEIRKICRYLLTSVAMISDIFLISSKKGGFAVVLNPLPETFVLSGKCRALFSEKKEKYFKNSSTNI